MDVMSLSVSNQTPSLPDPLATSSTPLPTTLKEVLSGPVTEDYAKELGLAEKTFMGAINAILEKEGIDPADISKVQVKGVPAEGQPEEELIDRATGAKILYDEVDVLKKREASDPRANRKAGDPIKKRPIQVESHDLKQSSLFGLKDTVPCAKLPTEVLITVREKTGGIRTISFKKDLFTNIEIPVNGTSREISDFQDKIRATLIGFRRELEDPFIHNDRARISEMAKKSYVTNLSFHRDAGLIGGAGARFRGKMSEWTGLNNMSTLKYLGNINHVSYRALSLTGQTYINLDKPTYLKTNKIARFRASPIHCKLINDRKVGFASLRNNEPASLASATPSINDLATHDANQAITDLNDLKSFVENEAKIKVSIDSSNKKASYECSHFEGNTGAVCSIIKENFEAIHALEKQKDKLNQITDYEEIASIKQSIHKSTKIINERLEQLKNIQKQLDETQKSYDHHSSSVTKLAQKQQVDDLKKAQTDLDAEKTLTALRLVSTKLEETIQLYNDELAKLKATSAIELNQV